TMDLGTDIGKIFESMYDRYPDKCFYVASLVYGEVESRDKPDGTPADDPVIKLRGVPFLQGMENSLRAVKQLNDYASFIRQRERHTPPVAERGPNADWAVDQVRRASGRSLVEREAKAILTRYGIPVT